MKERKKEKRNGRKNFVCANSIRNGDDVSTCLLPVEKAAYDVFDLSPVVHAAAVVVAGTRQKMPPHE